jgi:hypothetical protein
MYEMYTSGGAKKRPLDQTTCASNQLVGVGGTPLSSHRTGEVRGSTPLRSTIPSGADLERIGASLIMNVAAVALSSRLATLQVV